MRRGLRCPLGAHIRRMNPRDTALPVMTDVKLHRIIRHGTAYGPPLPDGVFEDDGQARGIFFIFLSATAPDTYEFLKKEWINDGNFLGLGTERDPIVRLARRHRPVHDSDAAAAPEDSDARELHSNAWRRVWVHAQPDRAALAQRARHLALVDRELITRSLVPSRAQRWFRTSETAHGAMTCDAGAGRTTLTRSTRQSARSAL